MKKKSHLVLKFERDGVEADPENTLSIGVLGLSQHGPEFVAHQELFLNADGSTDASFDFDFRMTDDRRKALEALRAEGYPQHDAYTTMSGEELSDRVEVLKQAGKRRSQHGQRTAAEIKRAKVIADKKTAADVYRALENDSNFTDRITMQRISECSGLKLGRLRHITTLQKMRAQAEFLED